MGPRKKHIREKLLLPKRNSMDYFVCLCLSEISISESIASAKRRSKFSYLTPTVTFLFQALQQVGVAKPHLLALKSRQQLRVPDSLEPHSLSGWVSSANASSDTHWSSLLWVLISEHRIADKLISFGNNKNWAQTRLQDNEKGDEAKIYHQRTARTLWQFIGYVFHSGFSINVVWTQYL